MWYVCDVLYAVLYVCVCCFVVCGCAVSRRYIVCYCDMFSVVNVYLAHLKFCVVCVNGRRYVCCVNVMLCNYVADRIDKRNNMLKALVGSSWVQDKETLQCCPQCPSV